MFRLLRNTILILIATLLPVLSIGGSVSAVTAADWHSGRIIDDGVFTNGTDMTVAEIQAFLNSHVGTGGYASIPGQCDTQGALSAQPYSSATRAEYARSLGREDKFTCLNIYYEVPKTAPGPDLPASNYGGAPIPAGAISAAQIIYNSAVKYNINPKALLVKLATESAGPLTSDDWPFRKQFLYAMGAHCPDSGPGGSANCDTNYAGFSIQVDEAASLLRWYLDSMTQSWWQYKKPYQVNSIMWNVAETGCGAGDVYIETKATAALYTYTPYQPNQAALNNMYGTGDGCSAYGNRNFWRVWSDWFGSPLAPSYAWQLTSQYAFTDSSKTVPIGLNNLLPGQRAYIGITAKNIGNSTWSNTGANPVRIGATRDIGRSSAFYDPTWLGYSRPATMKEASVATGETGTFEFWITAPESNQGNFKEYFGLLAEGKAWMPDIGLFYNIYVQPPQYTWNLTSQYAFTDDSKTSATGLANLQPGQRAYVGFTAKNTGNITWKNNGSNPLRIGTTHTLDRSSPFYDSSWISPSRPALMKESSVAPGQTATFEFWMRAPMTLTGGNYNEYFNPLLEGKAWLADPGMNFAASVIHPTFTWNITSQYAFTDSSKATATGLGNLSPNQVVYVGFTATNTGNVIWRNTGNNPVRLGTTHPLDGQSVICDSSSWISCSRPTSMKELTVAPGQTATFEFNLKAPANPGVYRAYFTPLSEGFSWMQDIGFNYYLVVK